MHDATRVIRAGIPEPSQGHPFLPGPTFAAPFHVAGDPASAPYTYGRFHNPTWTLFEKALGELEGGEAVVFASGMAATAGDAQRECLEGARLLWLESPSMTKAIRPPPPVPRREPG